eukprot:1138316-Pelagomonas_calceolata.AAC.10
MEDKFVFIQNALMNQALCAPAIFIAGADHGVGCRDQCRPEFIERNSVFSNFYGYFCAKLTWNTNTP